MYYNKHTMTRTINVQVQSLMQGHMFIFFRSPQVDAFTLHFQLDKYIHNIELLKIHFGIYKYEMIYIFQKVN